MNALRAGERADKIRFAEPLNQSWRVSNIKMRLPGPGSHCNKRRHPKSKKGEQ